MKNNFRTLIICIAIPLAVGGLSAFLTRNSMATFATINKPFLSPPGWLFPIVWTILYILMGFALYLVLMSKKPNCFAISVFGLQLAFNFFWSIIFFNLSLYLFAFIWLILLWLLIIINVILFYRIVKYAGYLMIPYLLWVSFAGYLNYAIYLLN